MKNYEKYTTPEEAFKEHVRFCKEQSKDTEQCHRNGCKYATGTTPCILQWLYDEEGEEENDMFTGVGDWEDVEYWAEMPKGELKND